MSEFASAPKPPVPAIPDASTVDRFPDSVEGWLSWANSLAVEAGIVPPNGQALTGSQCRRLVENVFTDLIDDRRAERTKDGFLSGLPEAKDLAERLSTMMQTFESDPRTRRMRVARVVLEATAQNQASRSLPVKVMADMLDGMAADLAVWIDTGAWPQS